MPAKKRQWPKQIEIYGRILRNDLRLEGDSVFVYTDAAERGETTSTAYVSTSGLYGIRAHPMPARTSGPQSTIVAELRAIALGFTKTRSAHPGHTVTILTDSLDALRYMRSWKSGETALPPGYSTAYRATGKTPTLIKLRNACRGTAA
ncbi:hypothetical protein [Embleya sp. NPDC059237]|uniref:hypothetical protein n=1 Tax=Embleya sp. NPDC059237 TaxID=3346784 RepID=UPI0036B2DAAA